MPNGRMMQLQHDEQNLVESLSHMQVSLDTCKYYLDRSIKDRNLAGGRTVHAHIVKTHFETDISLATRIVHMYFKCGSLGEACETFVASGLKNIVLWNALIGAHCQHGFSEYSIFLFWRTEGMGIIPNEVTYLVTLKACASFQSFRCGCQVYAHMIANGVELVEFTENTLIDMFAKCGSLEDACQVFREVHSRTVTSWNVLISGFAQHGHFDEVLHLFRKMIIDGFQPDNFTLVTMLRACADTVSLLVGRFIHEYISKNGTEIGVFVANAFMAMYSKCGILQDAWAIFMHMPKRDVISWNTMIGGFSENKQNIEALELFHVMRKQDIRGDRATFISSLKVCVCLDDLDMGRKIHACFIEDLKSQCILIISTLVDVYAKCGSTEDARRIFDKMHNRNVVIWNVMIAGYSHCGKEAFKLAAQMVKDGLEPTEVTFLNLLGACTYQEDWELCHFIHSCCLEGGYETDLYIGSSLVDVYSGWGRLIEAWRVFEVMPERNVVSWNALVQSCVEQGNEDVALELAGQMEVEGLYAEGIAVVSIFNACADLADLKQGKRFHSRLLYCEQPNLFEGNSLVDMYGKCGALNDALRVFNNMPEKDVVSWNAVILGFAQHGYGRQALTCAKNMKKECIQYNEVTIVGILTACSSVGLIEEARTCFDCIYREHSTFLTPTHCACMVDVYGRAGLLNEAVEFIKQMPMEPTSVVWMALLGSSRTYGSIELASYAASEILVAEPENFSAFLLFSTLQRFYQGDCSGIYTYEEIGDMAG